MIRRLIILLLIVGCVFGDTIKWQDVNAKGKTYDITNVDFQYINYQQVYYLDYRGEKVIIECPKVVSITDSEGNEIEFDCDDGSFSTRVTTEEEIKVESSKDVQSIIQNTKKPLVGGIFIVFGGGLLIGNVGVEIETEADYDTWTAQQKIGYGLITIGGVLITLGI